ncbi:MAG TPA: hypothetical protein VF429_06250 [Anaerolineae bacterium]
MSAGVGLFKRQGLGRPPAPGETRTVSGAIHLTLSGAQAYWAGLVREQVARL